MVGIYNDNNDKHNHSIHHVQTIFYCHFEV